ncbi:MAG: hypothetical protein KGL02_07325, partial [Acidobacteriota bacterium]|nr:hypothetical protein [Acidobacteriota bacterium]
MQIDFRIRRDRNKGATLARWLCALVLGLALLAAISSTARAQNLPTQPIGRIEGADVTVDSGMPASMATADSPASIYVSNGSVVTVHSGKARLTLDGGGELDICGPAKFTMLASGNDVTVALNIGRLRVELPPHISLKIFSPTMIATPIDINGGSRDLTVGLDTNDSLCVLATSGAIQLEHQFTGEKLIAPQAGEFSLIGGTLVPLASKPGSCGCAPMEQLTPSRAPSMLPELARAAPQPAATPQTRRAPAPAPPPQPAAEPAAPEPPVPAAARIVIPVNPDDERPVAQPSEQSAGEAPAIGEPIRGEITPALAFMASAPPPDREQVQTMLLVKN